MLGMYTGLGLMGITSAVPLHNHPGMQAIMEMRRSRMTRPTEQKQGWDVTWQQILNNE
jgi:hypothetical protein